ncbi:MAG TPA: hypothetical protein VM759_10980 [Longimicrobium sp.]|nr:hypothetical protein [Longimicrobium sp.]
MRVMEPAGACPQPVEFWARQFVECWYRGQGHVANDFRRFVSAHRVPGEAHAEVRERAQELLLVDVPYPALGSVRRAVGGQEAVRA